MNKEVQAILRDVRSNGYMVERGRKHWQVRHPETQALLVTVADTPPRSAIGNIKADLRRVGALSPVHYTHRPKDNGNGTGQSPPPPIGELIETTDQVHHAGIEAVEKAAEATPKRTRKPYKYVQTEGRLRATKRRKEIIGTTEEALIELGLLFMAEHGRVPALRDFWNTTPVHKNSNGGRTGGGPSAAKDMVLLGHAAKAPSYDHFRKVMNSTWKEYIDLLEDVAEWEEANGEFYSDLG